MDLAAYLPAWLDAFLIAPFRWPSSAHAGIWLGSALLASYTIIIGELFAAGLFLLHHRYYTTMHDGMVKYHNLSVDALHAGNKEAYLAANKMAQDEYGKSFFAQAAIGMASLWPVPFALGWMALRFEGITLYSVPGTDIHLGYVFVFLSLYIVLRITFSARFKNRLPFFRRVAAIKREAQKARGTAKPFFNPPPEKDDSQQKPEKSE